MVDGGLNQMPIEEMEIPNDGGEAIVFFFYYLSALAQGMGELLPGLLEVLETFGELIADIDSHAASIDSKMDQALALLTQIEINTRPA